MNWPSMLVRTCACAFFIPFVAEASHVFSTSLQEPEDGWSAECRQRADVVSRADGAAARHFARRGATRATQTWRAQSRSPLAHASHRTFCRLCLRAFVFPSPFSLSAILSFPHPILFFQGFLFRLLFLYSSKIHLPFFDRQNFNGPFLPNLNTESNEYYTLYRCKIIQATMRIFTSYWKVAIWKEKMIIHGILSIWSYKLQFNPTYF